MITDDILNNWNNFAINDRINLIFEMSRDYAYGYSEVDFGDEELRENLNTYAVKTYKKESNKILKALLLFICDSLSEDLYFQKSLILQKAHTAFLKSIIESYPFNDETMIILKRLFPICEYKTKDGKLLFCDPIFNNEIRVCSNESRSNCKYDIRINNSESLTWTHFHLTIFRNSNDTQMYDFRDFLYNIHFEVNKMWLNEYFTEDDDFLYPYAISAFINRLPQIYDHLRCNKPDCGKWLLPDFDYKSRSSIYPVIYFACEEYCLNTDTSHNHGIYINHCYECRRLAKKKYIIDGRECKKREADVTSDRKLVSPPHVKGMYLCMRCGGTKEWRIKAGEYCPNCGKKLPPIYLNKSIVRCPYCAHNGSIYGEHPVSTMINK